MIFPTLDFEEGVTDVISTIRKLYDYALTCDLSQSKNYGKTNSLKAAVAYMEGDTEEDVKRRIHDTLLSLYKDYFDNVTIDVNIGEKNVIEPTIHVIYNEKEYRETFAFVIKDNTIAFDNITQNELRIGK